LTLATPASPQQSATAAADRQILVMVRHPPAHFRPNASYNGAYGDDLARSARARLAKRIARQYGLKLLEDWPMPMIGVDCFIMAVPDGLSTKAAADQVSRDARVAWTQPVQLYDAQQNARSPNDPLYPAQPAARQWRLGALHQLATGRGVTVAVIDSGIDGRHPDLSGQLAVNENFVRNRAAAAEEHGTGVAGIIAAKGDNGVGVVGVAPGARLMGLRACWQEGRGTGTRTICDSLSLAKALYFAIEHRAQVINLSLSGPSDPLLGKLLRVGLNRGEAVITAFDRGRPDGGFPASVPGVIAVSDQSLAAPSRAVYIAPGRDVPTTQPGGRWYLVNGSSFAAAHVSGLVALVRERRASAPMPAALVSAGPNSGPIDACATLVRLSKACDCACAPRRTAARR
jgi:subtilisin family serine protease